MKTYPLATIGITMGDAAGVGPEIIMKSLDHAELYERCRPLVIGDAGRLREAGEIVLAGSFTRPMWVERGDTVHADYGDLGAITCRFL